MAQVEITTVKAQQQIKNLKDEIRVLFKHMQTLNREFNKQVAVSARLSNALVGKLTPAERRVAAIAKGAEAAFVRQARATNVAREQTLNFAQALRSAGATQQQQKFILQGVNQSLAAYQKRMSSGVLTTRQFQEAQARLNRTFGSAKRSLSSLSAVQKKQAASANGVAKSNKGLTTQLKNLGSSAIFAVGPLSGIGARINALGAIATRTGVRIAVLAASFVALAVLVFKIIKGMVNVTIAMTKMRNALRVATGSAKAAREEFKFLVATSRRLFLDISKVGGQFAKLAAAARGTSLAGQGVRDIFEAISAASLVLSLSADQTAGALKAIEQIISKGTVQAEELRGQLGERLPGAFQIAARAMGVTTKALGKLLELGLVVSTDFIPKFAAELKKMVEPQVAEAVNTWTASINKLKTELFLFFDFLEEKTGFVETMVQGFLSLGRAAEFVNKMVRGTEFPSERFGPDAPSLTFDQLRDLSRAIVPVEKFRDSLIDMREVLKSLQDPNLSIKRRLGLVDDFKTLEKAGKEAAKVMRKLGDEEVLALRTRFDGTLRSMEEVRVILIGLVTRYLKTKKAIDETTTSLEKQAKSLKDIREEFLITPFMSAPLESLTAQQELNLLIGETVSKLKFANDVLRIRLSGLSEEADLMEIRNKLEKEFGGRQLQKTRDQLEGLLKTRKELTDRLKEQNDLRKASAKLAKDFSRVIGTAFEDAVIKGNSFRDVLKGILDDIQRIILRMTITKRLETFFDDLIGDGGDVGKAITLGQATGESVLPDFLRKDAPTPTAKPLDLANSATDTAKALNETVDSISDFSSANVLAAADVGATGQALSGVLSPAALQTAASTVIQGASSKLLTTANTGEATTVVSLTASLVVLKAAADSAAAALASVGGNGVGSLFASILGGIGGGGGGGGGGTPPKLLKHGGSLRAGQLSVVGEGGPEFFRPNVSGTIIPANMNAPSSVVIHQTFDFRGASLEAVALLRRESSRIRRETIAEVERRGSRGITVGTRR